MADLFLCVSLEPNMQTSEAGSDTTSTVTLQTSVAGQQAVQAQVVQQVPVQQQVGYSVETSVILFFSVHNCIFHRIYQLSIEVNICLNVNNQLSRVHCPAQLYGINLDKDHCIPFQVPR